MFNGSTKFSHDTEQEKENSKQSSGDYQNLILEGHHDFITCILSLSNERIVSGSNDGEMIIWNSRDGLLIKRIHAHSNAISCMVLLTDEMIVTGSLDNTLKLWNLFTYTCVRQMDGHIGGVSCVILLEGITVEMIGAYSSEFSSSSSPYFDRSSFPSLNPQPSFSNPRSIENVDPLFISGGNDELLKIWSAKGKENQLQRQENDTLHCLLQMGGLLITGSDSKYILVYDLYSVSYKTLLSFHQDSVRCLLKLSEELFLSGSLDGSIRLWDVTSFLPIVTFENPNNFFDPIDASRVYGYPVLRITHLFCEHIVAAIGKGFNIYDLNSQKSVFHLNEAHRGNIVDLIPLFNGFQFATCSEDSDIKMWKITSGGQKFNGTSQSSPKESNFHVELIEEFFFHNSSVNKLCAYSVTSFASGGADNLVIVWNYAGKHTQERRNEAAAVEQSNNTDSWNVGTPDNSYSLKKYCRECRIFNYYEPDIFYRSSIADEKYGIPLTVLEYVRGMLSGGGVSLLENYIFPIFLKLFTEKNLYSRKIGRRRV